MPRPVGELLQIGIFLQQWSLASDFTEAERAKKERDHAHAQSRSEKLV